MGSINNKNKKNNKQNKTILYVFILIIVFLFSSAINKNFSGNYSFIKLSDFMAAAKNGQIEKANVLNETVMGTLKDGSKFKVFFPEIYIYRNRWK